MVPKLRFKGFNKNWVDKKLDDVFSFKNGLNARKEMYGKGVKFINVLDIINNEKIIFDVIQESVIATDDQISAYQVKQGDILFQRSSETREEVGQANVYVDSKVVLFGGFVIRARPIVNINSIFLNFQFKTDKLRKDITQRSGGSTRYNIGQDSLGKVTAFFPEIDEQTKIADFLSSVDEKIALLNKQYQLLCQYKRGMMQKIFSQELRLGGFKERWVSKYLGNIASKIGSGSTPRGGSEVYQSTGVPFIRSQNVHNGQLNLKDLAFISSEVDEKMKGSRVKSGDVLLNITGASIGRSCVVPEYFKHGNVNQHVCIIRLPNDHPKFLQAFISSEQGQKLIDNSQSGSGREGLNFENIRNFKIYFPSIEEQTKIADFLSAIDDKITAKKVQLDKLKTWKQGLLQQMFV